MNEVYVPGESREKRENSPSCLYIHSRDAYICSFSCRMWRHTKGRSEGKVSLYWCSIYLKLRADLKMFRGTTEHKDYLFRPSKSLLHLTSLFHTLQALESIKHFTFSSAIKMVRNSCLMICLKEHKLMQRVCVISQLKGYWFWDKRKQSMCPDTNIHIFNVPFGHLSAISTIKELKKGEFQNNCLI